MIPEELIERFVEIGYEKRNQYRTVLDARRRAPAQIQLILSAVRDGELDEALGVVGHGRIFKSQNNWRLPGHGWFVNGTCEGDLRHTDEGYPIIALHKEEKK